MSRLTIGLLAALAAAPAFAQSTSSGVGGTVTGADGKPVAGAEVTITHVESGTVSRAATDANGRYVARGLRVGGPYTISVTKAGVGVDTEDDVYLELNKVSTVDAQLVSGDATTVESVKVTGSNLADTFNSDNKGVGTSVSGRQLKTAVQGNRALDDIARLDPRVNVTDQGSGAISVAGVNNRFNEIKVDGMSQGDPFGLNPNGMPYVGSPISVDTIAAYDIKVSDYDVAMDAVGANINAVTKSGTNEFHGSVYHVFRDASSMVGKRDGQEYTGYDTDRTTGVTLGGPVLKDKLFFFASYEEQKVTNFGGAGIADGVANGDVTLEEVNQVIEIAKALGMQPGVYGSTGVNLENKRYLGKLDWNISDFHRASLTYQQTEEFRPTPYDQFADTVVLSSHWYNLDNVTKNTSLQLFSDWTENFSTEAKVSVQKFNQVNGNPITQPDVQVDTASGGTIYLGEDKNRHENEIATDKLTASVFGTWYAGNHTVKGGFDYLRNDIYNMYGRALYGEYDFDSIEDFAAGNYSQYVLRLPTAGYQQSDIAAQFVYTQTSPFLQDTWQVNDQLSVVYGVRVNIPKADKAPPASSSFEQAFGFSNSFKLGSDNKVVLPRAAFNYLFDGDKYRQLRGGVGLFQSVPPYVWLANPYQNNGVVLSELRSFDPDLAPFSPDPYAQNCPLGPGACPVQPGSGAIVDTVDPDFKLPTMWKASLGFDAELPWWGMIGTVELQHFRAKDAIFYRAINIGTPNGQLADGRDSYWRTLGSTSSSNKNFGRNPNFSNQSTMLSNTDEGKSTAFTASLSKPMSDGWYGNLSATYTRATEVNPGSDSTAWSGYQYVARVNPNEEIATNADRNIALSLKASLGWERAFFGDYKTSISAYYNGHDGLPYTWMFATGGSGIVGDPNGDGVSYDPAYIPLVNDPKVSYGSATPEQIQAFHEFISSDPYLQSHRGRIAERNASRMPWVNQLDVGIQQELPGFFKEHKSVVRLDIYNFLNLLNEDWGVTENLGGFGTRTLAGVSKINPDGTYVYNIGTASNPRWQNFQTYDASTRNPNRVVSRWSLLLTLRYEF